jgi:hypothetical protein
VIVIAHIVGSYNGYRVGAHDVGELFFMMHRNTPAL